VFGYLVNNALGHLENDMPRMVKTPWFENEIPFEEAAEIGTKKVITDHSTIGILVTTDGSVTEIARDDYIQAEARAVNELKELNKPFVIVLNTSNPKAEETIKLKYDMENKYKTSVIACDCANLNMNNINEILGTILYEFPVEEIRINFPSWVETLDNSHWLKKELLDNVKRSFCNTKTLKQISPCIEDLKGLEIVESINANNIELGEGRVEVNIVMKEMLFYRVLTECTGIEVKEEGDLFSIVTELAGTKKEYDKIKYALEEVKAKGYGIVTPSIDELILEEPEMVKQGSRFGVKLKAKAPSIHMVRADIETEVSPIVGSEKQSEDLVNYLLEEFESDPTKIWESNIFGKSLHELVNEGLQNKLCKMPEDAQMKLQETLERIVNEGSGGLICIIL